MAYNSGFPMNYSQYNMPMPNQGIGQFPQQMQPSYQSQQIQSSGFIPVPSEEVARNYPVAPGNSVTFKNENAPYVYTKTMGFSQLDRPVFEKYKLVREDDAAVDGQGPQESSANLEETQKAIDDINNQIKDIWTEIDELKAQIKRPIGNRKKEEAHNERESQ